jgi:hypothetical protein
MSTVVVPQQNDGNPPTNGAQNFSQRVIDVGFFIALFLAGTGFAVAAFYLNAYLKGTQDILKSVADNPHLTDVGLSLLIQAKIVASKDSLLSCGVLTGISTTLIGFCLFLIGAKGNINATGQTGQNTLTLSGLAPGVFVIFCATCLIGVSVTHNVSLDLSIPLSNSEITPAAAHPVPLNRSYPSEKTDPNL